MCSESSEVRISYLGSQGAFYGTIWCIVGKQSCCLHVCLMSLFVIKPCLLFNDDIVCSLCTDMCVEATVCGGHSGSDSTNLSCASDQSPQTHIPGGLQILWCCAQVHDDQNLLQSQGQ